MQYGNCLRNIILGNCCLLMPAMHFNSVNKVAALWYARVLWPCCSTFLFKTYHHFASLLLQDASKGQLSREGVTQGALLPLNIP